VVLIEASDVEKGKIQNKEKEPRLLRKRGKQTRRLRKETIHVQECKFKDHPDRAWGKKTLMGKRGETLKLKIKA